MGQLAIAAFVFAANVYQGASARAVKEEEAQSYREAARRRLAVGTAEVQEDQRNKEFAYSQALAQASAQGTKTGDPGVVRLLGDIVAEGEYHVLARMYTAGSEAEGLRHRGRVAQSEGRAAMTAGVINGITSAVSAYQGFGKHTTVTSAPKAVSKTKALQIQRVSFNQSQMGGLDVAGFGSRGRLA